MDGCVAVAVAEAVAEAVAVAAAFNAKFGVCGLGELTLARPLN